MIEILFPIIIFYVRKAIYIFLGLLLLLTGGVFFFFLLKGEKKSEGESISFRLLLRKTHIVGRYNGKVQWELEADRTEKSSDERYTYIMGIKNGVFHDWEKGKLRFEAKKAIYDNLTKKLQLQDVHIWHKYLVLYAPLLVWEGEKRKIICEKGANFQTKKAFLTAHYLELDLDNSYLLVSKVTGRMKVEERL